MNVPPTYYIHPAIPRTNYQELTRWLTQYSQSGLEEDPTKYKYVKILKYFLYPMGAWPCEFFGQKTPLFFRYRRVHVAIQSAIVFLGQVNYLRYYGNDTTFFVKGQIYITVFLSLLCMIRGMLPNFRTYGEIVKKFISTFHLGHYRHKGKYNEEDRSGTLLKDRSGNVAQFKNSTENSKNLAGKTFSVNSTKTIYILIDKVSYYFTLYLIAMTFNSMILFNLSPMYQNYTNGAFTGKDLRNITLEYSVYHIYPGFDPVENFKTVTVINIMLGFDCAVAVCAIDLLLCVMVFQIIGHIQILRNNLSTMARPKDSVVVNGLNLSKNNQMIVVTVEMFDDEENEIVHKKLVECVQHHRMIVSFTNEISTFFGPVLGINYAFQLVSCCLLLLECSRGDTDALIRYAPMTAIIFGQLIQISVTFEIVGTVSGKLKESVYETPWEFMNTRNRRTVCILLNRVQTPINVTAMGLTTVGVKTMAGILKTTFSYFAFLRSLQ